MKKLLINGCSFGQVWVPDDKFSQDQKDANSAKMDMLKQWGTSE